MGISTLSGIRVLDLSCLLPEFRCSMMLENLGPEVEKKNLINLLTSEKVAVFLRIQGDKGLRPALVRCCNYLQHRLSFIMMIVYRQYDKANRSGPEIRVKYRECARI